MSAFSRLIRFQSAEDSQVYFADLGSKDLDSLQSSETISAYKSLQDLSAGIGESKVSIGNVLAPLPRPDLPVYCVGLNYKSHAEECNLTVSKNPPLWCKPAAALASPGEDIPINSFCASGWLDYEGELVFVTSRECRDLSVSEAATCIAGYTIGNDLSCRKYQMPDQSSGQFFFAKGFDKFAPIGPVILAANLFQQQEEKRLITKVNGEIKQDADCSTDLIWNCAEILSFMSQGTTIPAWTAVMTGTPSGVGFFQKPAAYLKDGDIVEIEISGIGTLKNRMVFT